MSDYREDVLSSVRMKNVEQIVEAAKEYEYNAQVPLRYWLRTAAALLKEADIYMREGDDETTYLLLFRHAHLLLAHLETHPDVKDKTIKPLLMQARKEVNRNLKVLDMLKPRINQRYERYTSIVQQRDNWKATNIRQTVDGPPPENDIRQQNKRKVQHLRGAEDSELAVRLAQQEFQRRAAGRESSKQPTSRSDDGEDLSRRLQAIRARVDTSTARDGDDSSAVERRRDDPGIGYSYPNVKTSHSRQYPEHRVQSRSQDPFAQQRQLSAAPALPPKPTTTTPTTIPPRPEKVRNVDVRDTSQPNSSTETTYTFAPTAFLENGNPLRTLFLPPTLRTTFLRLAYQNTKANLETCGFLAGTLISNALFVSKLIIPAQVSTSDTCEMTNESQLFDYVDSGADLMILGWIHTHPSQTCFMSSRDLHTHAGYQMMLPESVAIVCAPSKGDTTHGGDWGVYRLTDPPGKMAILNCSKPGIFHPHEVENVYTDALRPGHVVEAKGLEFEVVDLRNV